MLRRVLIAIVFVYLALDVSVPSIPGAFVFEADLSTEITRAHHGAELVVAREISREPSALDTIAPVRPTRTVRPDACVDRQARRWHSCLGRAIVTPAVEDPH